MKNLSEAKLRQIIREESSQTVKTTVKETLRGLGVDVDHPLEVQNDLSALREWRVLWSASRKRAVIAVVGVLATAAVTSILMAIRTIFGK
jgi:hypothetical protein